MRDRMPEMVAASAPSSGFRDVTDADVARFRHDVLSWFAEHGRDLPWRHTRDPYAILVSEVMLQQTQVSRVVPHYGLFLARFPTAHELANAPTADVLRQWQGLGYNRRALFLKRAAVTIVETHGGVMPRTVQELETLPGVGAYTARAVACFAFDVQVPVVDTNVRRVLTHVYARDDNQRPSLRDVERLAWRLLPQGCAWEWNQALMDYGALIVPRRVAHAGHYDRAAAAFEHSDRFWRGKIVDVLRTVEGRVSVSELVQSLPEAGRNEQRVRGLVHRLVAEGLAHYDATGDGVSLPTE